MTFVGAGISNIAALDVADRIGRRLLRSAVWSGESCTWPVTVVDRSSRGKTAVGRVELAQESIYEGTAGIGLFLLELYQVTGEAELLRGAVGAFRHAMARTPAVRGQLGFYNGTPGVAWALARCGQVTGELEWFRASRQQLDAIQRRRLGDRELDLLGGAAGGIIGLLSLASISQETQPLELAQWLGDQLVERALRTPRGWCWTSSDAVARELTGISHGAAGIAQALLELGKALGCDGYRYAAEQGFAYEEAFFDPTLGNWIDLRHPPLSNFLSQDAAGQAGRRVRAADVPSFAPRFLTYWCHGAPGIALTRVRAYELLGDDRYKRQASVAIETTRRSLEAASHRQDVALCHGVLGLCETLLEASAVCDACHEVTVRKIAGAAARDYELAGRPWPSGVVGGGSDPGLMLGDAGVGYFFLRLSGAATSSVLLIRASDALQPRATVDSSAGESVTEMRDRYARQYFDRSIRVLGRLAESAAPSAGLPSISVALQQARCGDEIAVVYDCLRERVSTRDDPMITDALRPELVRFELSGVVPYRCDALIEALRRLPPEAIPWREAAIELAPHVRLVGSAYDWDAWLASPTIHAAPQRADVTYLAFGQHGLPQLQRLSPVAAIVLNGVAAGLRMDDIVAELGRSVDATSAQACEVAVRRQLIEAYAADLLRVTVPATTPSDIACGSPNA